MIVTICYIWIATESESLMAKQYRASFRAVLIYPLQKAYCATGIYYTGFSIATGIAPFTAALRAYIYPIQTMKPFLKRGYLYLKRRENKGYRPGISSIKIKGDITVPKPLDYTELTLN